MSFLELIQESRPLFLTSIVLLGLVIGSFLNVVILRLPVMLDAAWRRDCREFLGLEGTGADDAPAISLVAPRSRCPQCGHQISASENIPILSYLFLGGRCSACRRPISVRYPLIEAATAVLSLLVAINFGASTQTVAALLFTWALICLTLIDADRQILPDAITLPLLWLGLLLNVQGMFVESGTAIVGAAAGYLSLWTVFQLFRLTTGKEGMGYGDFKLLAALGAWLGWQALPIIIILSSCIGVLVGLSLIAFAKHDRSNPIPFGPYLATAGFVTLLWGDDMVRLYLGFSGLNR